MAWTCPNCERLFAHRDQPHACKASNIPGALDRLKPELRTLAGWLIEFAASLPGVRIEHASGSFMVKAPATFCSFRPRAKDVQVMFILADELDVFPIARTLRLSTHRVAHTVLVDQQADIDDQLKHWIREAYALSTSSRGKGQRPRK